MFRRSTFFLLGKPCPNKFLKTMTHAGLTAYFGVPDSLLKELCQCITWHGEHKAVSDLGIEHHVIAANEGNAIGLAAGYYLASSKIPVVYMQNSGFGNCVNPLTSICHKEVYSIPMVLLIGWRGRPGSKSDEPQHKAMGRLTEQFLQASEIPYTVLGTVLGTEEGAMDAAISKAVEYAKATRTPYAILVDRDTFGPVPDVCKKVAGEKSADAAASAATKVNPNSIKLGREEAIQQVLSLLPATTPVIGTTGMISREIFETRKRLNQPTSSDFLTVGAMGHASSIAMGVVLGQQSQPQADNQKRKVVCLDGDGAFLMHLGAAAITGSGHTPSNFVHIVLNNGAHDSVGGQPTVGFDCDLTAVAKSCGYSVLPPVMDLDDLEQSMSEVVTFIEGTTKTSNKHPMFLEIQCKKGNRADLGRPTSTAGENCQAFMTFVQTTTAGGCPPIPEIPTAVKNASTNTLNAEGKSPSKK